MFDSSRRLAAVLLGYSQSCFAVPSGSIEFLCFSCAVGGVLKHFASHHDPEGYLSRRPR